MRIRPPRGELKGIRGLLLFRGPANLGLLDMLQPGGIRIVLCQRAIGNHEDLHVIEQGTAGPKRLATITSDLIERLLQWHSATLELNVHHRQTIHQNGYVIAATVLRPILSGVATIVRWHDFVLVYDLQPAIVYMPPVNSLDSRHRAVITDQLLQVTVALNTVGLICDGVTLIGNNRPEELLPLRVRELGLVEQFQLPSQVGDQVFLSPDRNMFVRLGRQLINQYPLQLTLRLIRMIGDLVELIDRNHRTTSTVIRISSNQIVIHDSFVLTDGHGSQASLGMKRSSSSRSNSSCFRRR